MARSKRALSGGAKDVYLARRIAEAPGLDEDAALSLARRLKDEIALISLKRPARVEREEVVEAAAAAEPQPIVVEVVDVAEFDPYSPNVIVVIRTQGREALLAELAAIEDVANLRLLAREQQLSVAPELADAGAIRVAIIEAAERRIANRRAAAS